MQRNQLTKTNWTFQCNNKNEMKTFNYCLNNFVRNTTRPKILALLAFCHAIMLLVEKYTAVASYFTEENIMNTDWNVTED